jgi:Tol biopolymer transport system component
VALALPALTPGTRLGPYEILDALGAGGMGEVYKARDTRLDRIVAIKVLSEALAADVASRERFEREARAISSLSHPNICVLHDVGRERPTADAKPVDFLVMEFLDGETLSARLARSTLKIDEALSIAIRIAAALDRAHRHGIVHRDLKPGNVMLTKGGVKLLDFGLARLARPEGSSGANDGLGPGIGALAELSMPTVSSPLTIQGAIVGTLQYMAPEQLEGKDVDARADIFSFGAVLYEMLAGKRPFEGKSQASLIAAILDHHPPPVSASRKLLPSLVDEVVAGCLAKDRDDRWQSARDVMRQLEWIAAQKAAVNDASGRPQTAGALRFALIGAAVAGALATASVSAWWLTLAPPAAAVVARFTIDLPSDQAFTRAGRRAIALSPDGTQLVYVANRQIYLRNLNDLTVAPLPGTADTDPAEPTFSPDGQWLAFWSAEQIKKVPIAGGTPVVVGPAQNPYGMTWEGNRLLIGQSSPNGIVELPANGGAARLLVAVDESKAEIAQSPQLIEGGRAILFTLRTGVETWDDASIVVQDLATGSRTVIVKGGTSGHVLPTGHLVYARESTLFAAAFDDQARAIVGATVPVQQELALATGAFSGAAQVAFSNSGALAFLPDRLAGATALAWLDRNGRVDRANASARQFQTDPRQLTMAPDGRKVAMTVIATGANGSRGQDVWIWDVARGTLTKLTATSKSESPIWTPDSRQVCTQNGEDVMCQDADGGRQPTRVASVKGLVDLGRVTPDGKEMIVEILSGPSNQDLAVVSLDGTSQIRPLLQAAAMENEGSVSPDGRWLAFESNESGSTEVYVRPYPDAALGRWQISNGGGVVPIWSRDGRRLYFLDIAASLGASIPTAIMSVAVQPGAEFVFGTPAREAKMPAIASRDFEVGTDGRFLIKIPAASDGTTRRSSVIVVQNWFEELNGRVPRR